MHAAYKPCSWKERSCALIVSGVLVLGSVATPALAATTTQTSTADKKETVYVYTTSTGEVREIEVSDTLTNTDGAQTLNDVSELDELDIKSETDNPEQTGTKLVWNARGEQVEYEGSIDKLPPIETTISFTLDGKPVSPDELLGKDGHVVIRFDYTNTCSAQYRVNGKDETIYTPFMAVTGVSLKPEHFSNVSVVNGRVLDEAGNLVVVGYAFPGLQESLGVEADDFEVPSYLEIEADVTNFELDSTLTLITPSLFDELDADEFDLGDITSSMDELASVMSQVVSGSSELASGLSQLAEGASALSTSSRSFYEKVAPYATQTTGISSGAAQLAEYLHMASQGAYKLGDGAETLRDYMEYLQNGDEDNPGLVGLEAGIGEKDDETPSSLMGLANVLLGDLSVLANGDETSAGLAQAQTDTEALSSDLASYKSDAQAIADSAASIRTSVKQAVADALSELDAAIAALDMSSYQDRLNQAKSAATGAAETVGNAASNAANAASSITSIQGILENDAAQVESKINSALSSLYGIDQSELSSEEQQAIAAAISALENANLNGLNDGTYDISRLGDDIKDAAQDVQNAADSVGSAADEVSAIIDEFGSAQSELANARSKVETIEDSADELSSVQSDASSLSSNLGDASSRAGSLADIIAAALTKVQAALAESSGLKQGISAVRDGVAATVKALGSRDDESTLIGGAHAISAGNSELGDNLDSMREGADTLSLAGDTVTQAMTGIISGLEQLTTYTTQLSQGNASAADGANQLASGLSELNSEGIQAMSGEINDATEAFKDRAEALGDAARSYSNFSGIAEGQSGSVSFIYKSDPIKAE